MFTVTSQNRTAAKRLLNNWHDSVAVRTMTLHELQMQLQTAVNSGLITIEGVERTLAPRSTTPNAGTDTGNGKPEKNDTPDEDAPASPKSTDGDKGNAPETGASESSESESSESESDADGAASESESDATSESESGSKSESGESESGESEESENENDQPEEDQPEREDGMIEHPRYQDVLKYVRAGIPVALVGPTGSGKSCMADMVWADLGLKANGCGALLSKYDLIGFVDAAGTYHQTPFCDAVVNGTGFTFDEMDASAPDAVVGFNAATDGQKTFTFPHGQFQKHANARFIACLNTWGVGPTSDYVGRMKQDAAVMNRYAKVFIDYDPRVEAKAGDADIVERCQSVRAACTALGIRHIVSTRTISLCTDARNAGVSKASIDSDLIFAGLNPDAIEQIKTQMKGAK